MNMDLKSLEKITGAIMIGIGGIAAMHYGYGELAGVCFGALATWVLKNGYNNYKQNKS